MSRGATRNGEVYDPFLHNADGMTDRQNLPQLCARKAIAGRRFKLGRALPKKGHGRPNITYGACPTSARFHLKLVMPALATC